MDDVLERSVEALVAPLHREGLGRLLHRKRSIGTAEPRRYPKTASPGWEQIKEELVEGSSTGSARHLFERFREREITAEDLYELKL
jgi:hypothetical protein